MILRGAACKLPLSGLVLALGSAGPALAELPAAGACFSRDYDAAHLARNPDQGVAALRLLFLDEYEGAADRRIVIVRALMADQGQGRRDGVAGLTLQSTMYCSDDPGLGPACFVDCDGGHIALEPTPQGLRLQTSFAALGQPETCGASSDLAEGGPTRYRLDPAPPEVCADLARVHPLPEPGCWGAAYVQADPSGMVAALTLRLDRPDLDARPAFPWLQGVLAVDIAPRALGAGDLAGARVMLPLWCASDSGTCRAGADAGLWGIAPDGDRVVLTSDRFQVFDMDDSAFDITGGVPVRHLLHPLSPAACAGMVLE